MADGIPYRYSTSILSTKCIKKFRFLSERMLNASGSLLLYVDNTACGYVDRNPLIYAQTLFVDC